MTDEERAHLDHLASMAGRWFAIAAERRRASEDGSEPVGLGTSEVMAADAVEAWRHCAAEFGVDLIEAPADPDAVEGEPEGLSADMLLLYRQFRAQAAAIG